MKTFTAIYTSPHGPIVIENDGQAIACTEPVQVGKMTYQRPTPQRMIIDHTRVFEGFEGKGIARQMVLAGEDFAVLTEEIHVRVFAYFAGHGLDKSHRFYLCHNF